MLEELERSAVTHRKALLAILTGFRNLRVNYEMTPLLEYVVTTAERVGVEQDVTEQAKRMYREGIEKFATQPPLTNVS